MKKFITLIVLWLVVVSIAIGSINITFAKNSDTVSKLAFTVNQKATLERVGKNIALNPGESESQKREREEAQKNKPAVAAKATRSYSLADEAVMDLAGLRALYSEAASRYGIDWRLIEAVHQVESGKSSSTCKRSYAGATGPMQFLPSTFSHYSDGDVCNLRDSVFAAANLLASAGADRGDIDSALLAYNHSWSYVQKVKQIMSSI